MKFERGKDLKETIRIGRIGNPTRISSMHHPDLKKLEGLETVSQKSLFIMMAEITAKDIKKILQAIVDGEITDDWKARYYIAHWGPEGDEESWDFTDNVSVPGKTISIHFSELEKFSGEYLEFENEKYLIP